MSDDFETLLERWLRERGRTDPDALHSLAGFVVGLPPRRSRTKLSLARLGAIVATVALGVAFVTTLTRPSIVGPAGETTSPSPGATTSQTPTLPLESPSRTAPSPSPDPDVPGWALDLSGQLDCEGTPAPIGYERGDGPAVGREGTASPYPWLYGLRGVDAPDLPLSGWSIAPSTPWEYGLSNFTRHVVTVGGRVKAIILMEGQSTQGGVGSWSVTAFRACPAAEFDPTAGRTTDNAPWFDAAGSPVTGVSTTTGPGHCGWESTVWLRMDDEMFLRDPLGIFADRTIGRYREEDRLPGTAIPTGYRNVRWQLFRAPDGDSVLMLTPTGRVEVWPRSSDPFLGCV